MFFIIYKALYYKVIYLDEVTCPIAASQTTRWMANISMFNSQSFDPNTDNYITQEEYDARQVQKLAEYNLKLNQTEPEVDKETGQLIAILFIGGIVGMLFGIWALFHDKK